MVHPECSISVLLNGAKSSVSKYAKHILWCSLVSHPSPWEWIKPVICSKPIECSKSDGTSQTGLCYLAWLNARGGGCISIVVKVSNSWLPANWKGDWPETLFRPSLSSESPGRQQRHLEHASTAGGQELSQQTWSLGEKLSLTWDQRPGQRLHCTFVRPWAKTHLSHGNSEIINKCLKNVFMQSQQTNTPNINKNALWLILLTP
jgi:hypothetical protein